MLCLALTRVKRTLPLPAQLPLAIAGGAAGMGLLYLVRAGLPLLAVHWYDFLALVFAPVFAANAAVGGLLGAAPVIGTGGRAHGELGTPP